MKKTFRSIMIIVLSLIAVFTLAPFSASAEDSSAADGSAAFSVGLSAVGTAAPGDVIYLDCTVKNISGGNGLIAVSFALDFNAGKVRPLIMSSSIEDSSLYDSFLKISPQYTMDADGKELPVSCYQNNSRCYCDGCFRTFYDIRFFVKETFSDIVDSEEPDPVIRKDGDFVLSIPFTVLDYSEEDFEAFFEVSSVTGTDAGNGNDGPSTVAGSGDLVFVKITHPSSSASGASVASEAQSSAFPGDEPPATGSETTNNADVISGTSAALPPDTTPKTNDGGLFAFALAALLSVAALPALKRR